MVAMREPRQDSGGREPRGGEGESQGGQMLSRVKEGASEVAGYVKEGARAARRKVRQTANEAARAIKDTVQEEAEQMYEKQKDKVVARVATAGKVAKQAAKALKVMNADGLAEYAERAGDRVEDATKYLEDHSLGDVLQDTGQIVRQHQALAVGAMLLAGFAMSRFLKASEVRQRQESEAEDQGDQREGEGEDDDADTGDRDADA